MDESVIVKQYHRVTPHAAETTATWRVGACVPTAALRLGMRVRGEHVKGSGTVLRSARDSALFSDPDFLTWNCRVNGTQQHVFTLHRCTLADIIQLSNYIFRLSALLKKRELGKIKTSGSPKLFK